MRPARARAQPPVPFRPGTRSRTSCLRISGRDSESQAEIDDCEGPGSSTLSLKLPSRIAGPRAAGLAVMMTVSSQGLGPSLGLPGWDPGPPGPGGLGQEAWSRRACRGQEQQAAGSSAVRAPGGVGVPPGGSGGPGRGEGRSRAARAGVPGGVGGASRCANSIPGVVPAGGLSHG